jgi:E3 ubiquitin-protein ligase HUWE1
MKSPIRIEFAGERGQDVGGLTRDFFIELSKEMFNQNYSLFKWSDNGSTYMPNPKSYVQTDHIRYFRFIGRVIGKAMFEGCLLECYFIKSIYKMMVGRKLNYRDLYDFDNSLFNGLNWCLLPTSNVDELYETFSTSFDYFGRTEVVDLVPNGRNIDVTNQNKEYYVERKAYFHLYKSVQQQIDAFLDGFFEIIPRELASIFSY